MSEKSMAGSEELITDRLRELRSTRQSMSVPTLNDKMSQLQRAFELHRKRIREAKNGEQKQ